MKKLLVFLFVIAGLTSVASPIKGGFLGKRIIISAEGSYMPNYSAFKDLFLSYNFQYGGRLQVISGRHSEIGVSYNMYGLGAHNRYDTALSNDGRIKGYQVGLTYRMYRKKRGGLAPIGKFADFNLYYHSDEYSVMYENRQTVLPVIVSSTGLSASIGFGTQNIFWNRVIANYGVRFGGPLFALNKEKSPNDDGDHLKYMQKRLAFKDIFSVFFGIGVIL